MPRQDVPYGGAICRLKERIAELFDLVGEKLHSINGVQGDGAGDVKIVSGDPAVVITGDAAQNEIEIALDTLRLPNGAVRPKVYVATIPQTDYLDVCQVQFVRIGLDKGLLSFSGHIRDISLPSDVWTLISIDTVMSAMGLTHRRPSSFRDTGWWHYDDGDGHGDRYGSGTVCQVSPAGGLELGRYYSGTDIGSWEISALGRDRYISVRDVYVEIEIPPDDSKRPIGTVSSVNGKTGAAATGAVALDAGDIPSDGNSNVQADIDAGKVGIRDCIVNINAEREARQNADAALQTNINAARASIPEMSTAPDPYKGIERDAQGRAFAADPASGATDKTLVTANWVCQTGGITNNLIHSTGEEIIVSKKIFAARPDIGCIDMPAITPGQTWRSLIAAAYSRNFYFLIINPRNSCICIDHVKIPQETMTFSLQRVDIFGTNSLNKYSIRKNSEGKYYLCINSSYHQGLTVYLLSYDDSFGQPGYEPLQSDDASTWEVVSE